MDTALTNVDFATLKHNNSLIFYREIILFVKYVLNQGIILKVVELIITIIRINFL